MNWLSLVMVHRKKVNLTGAVASVSTSEIEGKPVTNLVEALQGTTSGLVIQQSNSAPGARPSINIRGLNTMNNNDPMVLIDGIIGDIQNVNPSDIENISVLRMLLLQLFMVHVHRMVLF